MPLGPVGARDLAVGDVSDKGVPEAVLRLALHRARAGGPDELLAGQLVQRLLDLVRRRGSPIAATAPAQNTLPITEASCSRLLRSGGSVSRRAAISACTDSGTVRRPRPARRGPRAGARTPPRTAGCLPPAPATPAASRAGSTARSSRAETSRAVSSSHSGARLIVVALRSPPPRRRAARTAPAGPCRGRAAARLRAQSARCSRNASRAGSAQCRSSNTSTTARSRHASRNRRQAVNDSSCAAGSPARGRPAARAAPEPGPILVVLGQRPAPASRRLVRASRTPGCPHSAFTISPSAQNVIPSP